MNTRTAMQANNFFFYFNWSFYFKGFGYFVMRKNSLPV